MWDQSAGSLLINEAGGAISDVSGKPLNFGTGRVLWENDARGIVASCGAKLQSLVLEELKRQGLGNAP